MLEGSDVFTTHKLQINYRSNQEILDFANVLLENIEANQYARIQLQANSLKTVTEQSFLDAVKFHYHRVVRAGDITDELPMLTRTCLKPYVDDCIAKKEQIAVLAFTRKNITAIQEELKRLYPKLTIADITSNRTKPSTLFSNYIRHEWNNLTFAPTQNLLNIIVAAIQTNLSSMIGHSNNGNSSRLQWLANAYARQLYDWQIECGPTISAWQQQFNNGQITREQFMDFVKENMLQYEIHRNAVKQAMLSSKKRDRSFNETVQNADILISTVHGAKGLEFPHVILLFQSSRDMTEDAKRVYYVGLTRAMKSEYVLAYDTIPSPKVKADYETIIKTLHQRHPAGPVPAMPLVTGVPTKNQFCASIEDIEKGVIKLKPGLMPEAVIANPDDPAAAQAQLDAQAAANQVITNAQNQILAQNQAQAAATPAQAPAQTPFPQPVNTPPTPNTTPAPKGMPTPPVHSTWPQPAPTTTVVQPQANQMPFTQSMRPGQAINPVVNVQRPTVPTAPVVQVNAPATPVVKKTSPFPFNLPSDYLDQIKKSQPPKPGQ